MLGTVAVECQGIDELPASLAEHWDWLEASGTLRARRRSRIRDRTRDVVNRAAQAWIWSESEADRLIDARLDEVESGSVSPYDVSHEILDGLKQGTNL